MKRIYIIFAAISFLLIGSFVKPTISSAGSFDIGFIEDSGASNVLGLAIDAANSNIFLTSLSYGGQDNLWKFTSNGTLVGSTRANWNTGTDGNLAELTISNNGHLFVNAARDIDPRDGVFERYTVEMSKDGATIFSSFSTTHYLGGKYGITYNPDTDHLLIASGRFDGEFLIRETTLDGTQLNSSVLDPFRAPMDIAFDPITENILALTIRGDLILDEYSQNIQGDYRLLTSYSLGSVGITRTPLAIDVNRSNGLIYVQENNRRIVWFNRNDLRVVPYTDLGPVPEPTTMLLLGSGLFGLAVIGRKRFKK